MGLEVCFTAGMMRFYSCSQKYVDVCDSNEVDLRLLRRDIHGDVVVESNSSNAVTWVSN